ncbi:transcriptional regulator [Paenibacillus luteus]|uniref:transcriptional regulator n=1 Tax=Paenibacillus luteus TaxID=2545753 RepID=UPI001144EDA2|nr:transcriptional regulator [Paenibacillus luteus]
MTRENNIFDNMTLQEYLRGAAKRLPEQSASILMILKTKGSMNMNRLTLTAEINRSLLNKFVTPLEVMGLIQLDRYGMTKEYSLTALGEAFLNLK